MLETTGSLLRHRMFDTEALYRVLEEGEQTVMAEVVQAPGLARGTRVRLMTKACRAMERLEASADEITLTRRFAPASPHLASR
jgi:hypothetical protein